MLPPSIHGSTLMRQRIGSISVLILMMGKVSAKNCNLISVLITVRLNTTFSSYKLTFEPTTLQVKSVL